MKYSLYVLIKKKNKYLRKLSTLEKKYGLSHPLVLYTSRRLDEIIVEMQKRMLS